MALKAILFGSLGVLAETSDLYRKAFNVAFKQEGLDWSWTPELYKELIITTSGRRHIRNYASSVGQEIDEQKVIDVHTRKAIAFGAMLIAENQQLRPGILRLIKEAKQAGLKIGMVSTTSPENIVVLFEALKDCLSLSDFDVIVTNADAVRKKPDPECYSLAIDRLGFDSAEIIAIEDTGAALPAALDAGLACLATPGATTSGQDFSGAVAVVSDLDQGSVSIESLNTLLIQHSAANAA